MSGQWYIPPGSQPALSELEPLPEPSGTELPEPAAPAPVGCTEAAATVELVALQQRLRELLAGRHLPQLHPAELVDYLILREQAQAAAEEHGQARLPRKGQAP